MREDEALPTDCDDGGGHVGDSGVGRRLQVLGLGIPAVSNPRVCTSPAIISNDVVGHYVRDRIPVAGREARQVA